MIMILAASLNDAKRGAEFHQLKDREWIYITSLATLRGLVRPLVIRVGEYYKRSDIMALEHDLDDRNATFLGKNSSKRMVK